MASAGRRVLCCCLLAGARAGLEDAEALVQVAAESLKPAGLIRLGDDDPENVKQHKGNIFNTLALGAQVDGDSTIAQVLDGVGNMMQSAKPDENQPPRAILDGSKDDPLNRAAGTLSDWGKQMQNWFDAKQSNPVQEPLKIVKAATQALPAELRELGGQISATAKATAQKLEGAAMGLAKLEANVKNWEASLTEEKKKKFRENVGNFYQKRIVEGNHETRDAQNLRKLVNWFRQDDRAEKVQPTWEGINSRVKKINQFFTDPMAARKENVAEKSAGADAKAAAAAPEVPAKQPQVAPPRQAAPPLQPKSLAPAHMPVVGSMGFSNYQYGYPMAPPPMMQQPPMGGMPPYPMQQQQQLR